MSVAKRLESALEHAGMNQSRLAHEMGVKPHVISLMKAGKMPGIERWPQIAGILGVSSEWLVSGTGEAPPWASAGGGDAVREAALKNEIEKAHALAHATAERVRTAEGQAAQAMAELDQLRMRLAMYRYDRIRRTRGLTDDQVVKGSGVSFRTIYHTLHDLPGGDLKALGKVAEVLGTTADFLLYERGEPPAGWTGLPDGLA